jgi:hypothetical protein
MRRGHDARAEAGLAEKLVRFPRPCCIQYTLCEPQNPIFSFVPAN